MLTLLLGTDWTENRKTVLARIARDVAARRGNRILMVPELISHDTERRLAAAAGDTASRYAQVLSFTRLGRRVMDIVGAGARECLDASGRIVAMAAAARQLHSRLKVYAAVETKPEFLGSMVEAVDEFKRCCIQPADLMAASQQTTGSFSEKLQELALLTETYDALCSRGKRDPRDQMTWVLEQLEEIDFASKHTFYVDGFPDFTRQNMAILEHLILNSESVTVSLTCDGLRSDAMAFEDPAETALHLMRFAEAKGVPVKIEMIPSREDTLSPVRQKLFQGKLQYMPQLDDCVLAVRAGSVYQECQVAAQQIMRRVQQGCRYRDVSVVCTDLTTYIPTLRLIFGQCGIPLYLSGTEEVLQSGVISTVLLALDAALGGFEQRDVLRYLRSSLSPLSQDECDNVENYAAVWAISGKRWTENWTAHPRGLQDEWTEGDRAELDRLNDCRRKVIDPLLRLREGFRAAENLGQQVEALYRFLEETEYSENLSKLADAMDEAGDNRSAQILNQLWEILLGALEQLYDVLGQTVWEEDRFVRLLKLLLSQCDVGTIPPVLDAVSAGGISAMRCQQQKHLIVLGANEGNLPNYGSSGGLLSDQERVNLRSLGVPITGGAMDGLQAEFAEIYGVFCGAEESVTVVTSSPQPSFLYNRLAAMGGGEIPADTTLTVQLRKPLAAAGLLVKAGNRAGARELGIEAEYLLLDRRRNHRLGSISPEKIQSLYGKKLRLSPSQIRKQAECRLAYFLQYGLRARERREATVDPAEFGTFVHAVLESTSKAVMDKGGFHAVSLEETVSIAKEHAESYIRQRFSDLDSQRVQYLFQRNIQEMEMVVRELWRELSQAKYIPAAFELEFGDGCRMPGVEIPNSAMEAVIRGKVDRVDVWQRGESSYFRVVDYKTGKTTFDYCDVFNGVGMQMLLYLFALERSGGKIMPGKRISAGVQYFPARADYLPGKHALTAEEAESARMKSWKRSGLLLSDLDSLQAMDATEKLEILPCKVKDGVVSGDVATHVQMGQLRDYITKWLQGMVNDIASGNIEPNPYTRGNNFDACTYCPYGGVCHKDSVATRRNYETMDEGRFWTEIEREVGKNG